MEFLNPWGLLGLLAVPALVALYILRQKHKTVKVPSLLLWKRTQTLMEASTPWQKLKKSLLFLLQLLCVILAALAIARPSIRSEKLSDELIIIIDSSASMTATDGEGGKSRFELAVKAASSKADAMRDGQRITVITAGKTVTPVISRSDSKYEVKRVLKSLECGMSSADVDNAVLLAESMKSDTGSCEIILYTDSAYLTGEGGPEVVDLSTSRKNLAVMSLSSGVSESGTMALSVVESFGADAEVTLELLCDGVLTDAKKQSLPADTPVSVYWKNVPASAVLLTVRIAEDDILPADNSLCTAVSRENSKKVLIVSESGFFLEKVISAVSGYDVYKSTPANWTNDTSGDYELYIFDGFVPEKLPEAVPCWFIAPSSGIEGVEFGATIKGSTLSAAPTPLCNELGEYLNLSAITLARFREVTSATDGWENVFLCGKYPVLLGKQSDGRALLLLSFDIHDSNLPLLKEFPILCQNMLSYSIPVMTDGDGVFETGYTMKIGRLAYSTSVKVACPDGSIVEPSGANGDLTLTLSAPGVYKLTQTIEKNTGDGVNKTSVSGYVISKLPAEESSMPGAGSISTGGEGVTNTVKKGQLELWPYLIAVVLLLLTFEWWVYYRENKL